MDTRTRVAWAAALTLVASLAPDIVLLETAGSLPTGWLPAQAGLLLAGALALQLGARERALAGYGLVLAVVVAMQVVMVRAGGSACSRWRTRSPRGSRTATRCSARWATRRDLLDDRAAGGVLRGGVARAQVRPHRRPS